MGDVVVLEGEMFSTGEAARLLRVPDSTLRWWLEGGTRRGTVYPPVIRPKPTGSTTVAWGEFVEAGLLRQYRRIHDVPLSALRAFTDQMGPGISEPKGDER